MAITPMPLISRGVPAWTNDDFSGAFPATNANNAVYGGTNYWRCLTAPTGGADSGTLTTPVYLAYDLSSVPSSQRQQVLVHWDQSAVTGAYNPLLISNTPYNIPSDYTIDINSGAGGGSPPVGGWSTLATVASSAAPYHSRQHLVAMSGANWIRIRVTGIVGSALNNNVALNMDIHDAGGGATDSFFFVGDSITQFAFIYSEQSGLSAVMPQQITDELSSYYPVWEDGGVAGWTATDVQAVFSIWLALFPGKYVGLNLGTNDANQGGAYVADFSSKMTNMVSQIFAAGKIPIIPTIPWGSTANLLANVPTLNSQIASIISSNSGTLSGPDLYAYFNAHQSEIDVDGIHPTNPTGYNNYRTQWVNWALNNSSLYASSSLFPSIPSIGGKRHGIGRNLR